VCWERRRHSRGCNRIPTGDGAREVVHGPVVSPDLLRGNRSSRVVEVRPVRHALGMHQVLSGDGKHSSVHLAIVSELPVSIKWSGSSDVPRDDVSVGVLVGRLVVDPRAVVASTVRTIIRSSDGRVRADVDNSEDGIDSIGVVFPLVDSNRLSSGVLETVVDGVGVLEAIGCSSESHQGNFNSGSSESG